AVDLHRSAGQPEHGERNGSEREMIVEHHAEEARYQYLVGERCGRQHENRQIIATVNLGNGLQNACPLMEPRWGRALSNSRNARTPKWTQLPNNSLKCPQ